MLGDMYESWALGEGFQPLGVALNLFIARSERIQEIPGEAGFRSLTLQLSELPQQHVLGLVAESGVHRLIRMSPFDRKARPLSLFRRFRMSEAAHFLCCGRRTSCGR